MRQQVERIDQASPGSLGVYVKRLDTGETMAYGADRFWYLGSTVKVPVAIAVLQQVDAGTLKPGATADITLIDLDEPWLVSKEQLLSRSKNTPFEDARFSGRAVATYVAGKCVFGG